MGLNLVEIQQTDRYFVFGAPATSCKVNWPKAATKTDRSSTGSREPLDPAATPRTAAAQKKSTRPAADMTSEGSAGSAVSVGARKVLPEDVLLVAVHGARVDLHPASLDKACPVSCKPPRGGDKAFEVSRCEVVQTSLPVRHTRQLLCC